MVQQKKNDRWPTPQIDWFYLQIRNRDPEVENSWVDFTSKSTKYFNHDTYYNFLKNLHQLKQFMQYKGLTIERIHEKLDSDSNGGVDRIEFINNFPKHYGEEFSADQLENIFDMIVINKDRELSVEEFQRVLDPLKQHTSQHFRSQDKNREGESDFITTLYQYEDF